MSSMLAAVARAAGLDEAPESRRLNVVELPVAAKPATPHDPLAVALVIAAAADRSRSKFAKAPKATAVAPAKPLHETSEAKAYMAHLEAHGNKLDTRERNAILSYGMTWESSAEVRQEFLTFRTFAGYMRGKAKGMFK